ncbi:lipase family protein [Microbacterium pygmaeum]|uniref:Uncharacterized membrane protein HdeD, DUF308 family n=1 Tax=Microbacterium pygmaeum TaxID=370764 RepID=A0A1G7X2W5_9MICO|nr:lipase family protein [Microbacterium pygmaeum]SDG78533.1 Uncharacterized membrane protein HdeD, DUF308 family [Microbacterium pygmaeum]
MVRQRAWMGLIPRRGAIPRLLRRAPIPIVTIAGLGLVFLGALIITRPLTSIYLLGIYVALSAIISGVAELRPDGRSARLWERIIAGAWIVAGLAVLVFLDRSLDLLPRALAILLLIGGLASLGDVIAGGRLSERVLAAAWGASQIVFGVLALSWPDVTVLVVAVVFGVRTLGYGGFLLVQSLRSIARRSRTAAAMDESDEPASTTATRHTVWAAVGRSALAGLLVASSIGGWWLNGWLGDGAPVVDSFYDQPEDVPSAHGRLIRIAAFDGTQPPGADVSRMLYTTRDALGAPAIASALVIVPNENRPGARPVVAWNHGTTGVARGCAPSLRTESATRWAIPSLNEAISRGWVIVASDYSGQGTEGVFPYLIGLGEARSSLDAVLAAREIEGLALRPETVAWGHSQGGHAALWMAQIASSYAPDIEMRGTAVLAPVTDPVALADELTSGEATALLSVLISWVLVPYADTYADVDLERYIAPGSRAIVREMTQRCPTEPGVVVSVVAALGVSEDRPLYVGGLTSGPLGDRLEENAVRGPWDTPILVAWGDADEVIPPMLQEDFVRELCEQGDRARWVVYSGYTHLQTLLPGSRFLPVLINWTDARLRGLDRPDSDCDRYGAALS